MIYLFVTSNRRPVVIRKRSSYRNKHDGHINSCHSMAEILLKLALNSHQPSNQSIFFSTGNYTLKIIFMSN